MRNSPRDSMEHFGTFLFVALLGCLLYAAGYAIARDVMVTVGNRITSVSPY